MRLFNTKHNLLAIFVCTAFNMQQIIAVPPQELYGEPCQTYPFFCFIFFFMVIALCALIHKYCINEPTPMSSTTQIIDKKGTEK